MLEWILVSKYVFFLNYNEWLIYNEKKTNSGFCPKLDTQTKKIKDERLNVVKMWKKLPKCLICLTLKHMQI